MVRRIKAKLVPGLRDQGLSRNTIAMGYGMSKHSVINVFDAADRLGVSYGGVEDKKPMTRCMPCCFPAGVRSRVPTSSPTGRACTANWDVWASR